MNSCTVQDEISSYSPDLVEVSLVTEQVVYEMEAGFERINCVDALCTWLQSQDSEKGRSPHLRMEAVEVYSTCSCVLSQPLSGVATAENALKSGQTSCRIIFWHPAAYWKVGSGAPFV